MQCCPTCKRPYPYIDTYRCACGTERPSGGRGFLQTKVATAERLVASVESQYKQRLCEAQRLLDEAQQALADFESQPEDTYTPGSVILLGRTWQNSLVTYVAATRSESGMWVTPSASHTWADLFTTYPRSAFTWYFVESLDPVE